MRKLLIASLFVAVIAGTSLSGCGWPNQQVRDASATEPVSTNWMHVGKGTGDDPRAKAIEKRLGYE